MIKLNRITEYGLIALRHLSQSDRFMHRKAFSAREIADYYGFPFEITAKTLQRLQNAGFVQSEQGVKGGYLLQRSLQDISLFEFLRCMEGPQAIVSCMHKKVPLKNTHSPALLDCEYKDRCEIKGFMHALNHQIATLFETVLLSDLMQSKNSNDAHPNQNETYITTNERSPSSHTEIVYQD